MKAKQILKGAFLALPALSFTVLRLHAGPEADEAVGAIREPGRGPRVQGGVAPWKKWQKNPLGVAVSAQAANIYADTNTSIVTSLANSTCVAWGAGCSQATNSTDSLSAVLNLRRQYRLTVIATNLQSAEIDLQLIPTWQPLSNTGRDSKPNEYLLFVDGVPASAVTGATLYTSAGCDYYSNSWVIEIRDEKPYHWYADDGSDDPAPAAGDGTTISMGPGKTANSNQIALDWSVNLGRLFDGSAAGRLRIRENGFTSAIYTPTNIYYTAASTNARGQVELVASSLDGILRQVKSCQCFVDIVAATNQTTLNFYHPAQVATNKDVNGVYTNISGSPYVAWIIQNPEPSTTNKLYIIESRNSLLRTNSLVFDPTNATNTWSLKYGTGTEERLETRGIVFNYSSVTTRVETVAIKYTASNSAVYKCIETYRLFLWGWELVETRTDPDGSNLTTTFNFYEDPNDYASYRKPKSILYPDGYWELRLYDEDITPTVYGALLYILHPWKNSPASPDDATVDNSDVIYYAYNSNNGHLDYIAHILGDPNNGGTYYQWDWMSSDPWGWYGISKQLRQVYGVGIAAGTETLSANESQENGLAGHPFWHYECRGTNLSMAYFGGTYYPSSQSFTNNGTSVGDGPDWRQTVVYWNVPGHLEPDEEDIVEIFDVEGQPLLYTQWAFQGIWPETNRAYAETRLFHDGSLVQRDFKVFTGLDTNNEPVFDLYQRFVYKNDSLGHATNIALYDAANTSVSRVIYEADYRGAAANDGDLLLWHNDEFGIRTELQYDSLKRLVSTTKKGVSASGGFPAQSDIVTTVTYDPAGRPIQQRVTGGSLSVTNKSSYDLSGRIINRTDTNGLTTAITYALGGRVTTYTLPSTATEVRTNYLDRRLYTRTGTGVVQETHDYEPGGNWSFMGVAKTETISYGPTGARWKKLGTDWFGLPTATKTPDFDPVNSIIEYQKYSGSASDTLDHPTVITKTGQADQTFYFDFDGSVGRTDSGPVGGLNSTDKVTRTLKNYLKEGSAWFYVRTNYAYLTDNDATPTIVGISKERLSGFSSGNVISEVTVWDADTNAMVITTYVDRTTKKVTQVADTAQSTLNSTNITINGLLQCQNTPSVATPTYSYYDGLGRLTSIVSPLGFTATTSYDQYGQVIAKTDLAGNVTSYQYYGNGVQGAGKLYCETRNNGRKTYHSYTARGEAWRIWGDVPFPEERVYNNYGDLIELHTFRGGSGWNSSTWPSLTTGSYDATTWTYQEHSGFLTNKTDAGGHSISYVYTNGLLWIRTWARGVACTNTYNINGQLTQVDYSDGTTSVVMNNFDRAWKPRTIIDASGTNALTYDHASRLKTSACTGGLLAGITVSNHFNGLNGRDSLSVLGLTTTIKDDYGYDTYGRLGSVTVGNCSATYGYLPNSALLQTTTCKTNSTTVLTTSRSWDYGMRMSAIVNQVDNTIISSHGYQYDSLNRRTRAALEEGSIWVYDYDDRDELTSAHRHWADWSPVSGQQFAYAFDSIGNRVTARSGGDINGWNLRTTTYTANNLNEYTSVSTPGYKDVIGLAFATNAVTINSGSADRKSEYFHRELSIANSGGPLWQSVSVDSGGVTNIGGCVFPGSGQTLTYDTDGNLTFDGVWTYQWDGENRLKTMSMTNVSSIANTNRLKLDFAYDYMNRRFQKAVSAWNGSAFAGPVTNRFVYDAWNLIAELQSSTLLRSYAWGQDVSGTMDKAGGIGGLLLVTFYGSSTTNCFAGYDGNGNLSALISAADKSTVARYEYSPFGELIRTTGTLARQSPFRFSTKYADEDSRLVYFGNRYYSATLGRWISRDPAEEKAGNNLFAFVYNQTVNSIDSDGRWPTTLAAWAAWGAVADATALAFDASSIVALLNPQLGTRIQMGAIASCNAIDLAMSGALLKNIGGRNNFNVVGLAGLQLDPEQSWGYAIVSGRLEAVAEVGFACLNIIKGTAPSDTDSTEGLAYSFVQNARRGDTAYADLDAALLGLSISLDKVDYPFSPRGTISVGGMFGALLHGDAAGIAANLPSYTALNAWDMLSEIEPNM